MSNPFNELPDETLNALIAGERARLGSPLTEWQSLSAQLREEGLIRSPSEPVEPMRVSPLLQQQPRSRAGVWNWSLRVVTGAALLGIGVAAGLGLSTRHGTPSAANRAQTHAAETVAANTATNGAAVNTPNDDGTARLVSNVDSDTAPFASPEIAKQVLLRSQSDYQRAAAYLAASDTSAQIGTGHGKAHTQKVYQERLAALDAVMSTVQQALKDSPHDPLLHQYYQSTVGAHDATVQQLARVVPVGMQVSHF